MKIPSWFIGGMLMGMLCGCSSQRTDEPKPSNTVSPVKADAGPNRMMLDYLGNPVPPPANLDSAYSMEGLARGLQTAAQAAHVPLTRLEIDDSEFPFLVGVVCASQEDRQKLEDQLSKEPHYNYTGGWGGSAMRVMNLVPLIDYSAETRQCILRRLALREQILGDKISQPH
jgi:hypothetical protein